MENKFKDWKTMILVSHEFFHQWRKAVAEKYGQEVSDQLTNRFWELVGENTADSYIYKGNIERDNLAQVVNGIARSSEIMGETVEIKNEGDDILLNHTDCPWVKTFELSGHPGECQEGCDTWFKTIVQKINENFSFTTESCLGAGDDSCQRRFTVK